MDHKEHNDALAKLIQKNLKKDLPSVEMIRQGYKGTGSKAHRRQLVIRSTETVVDVWLDTGRVQIGGVYTHGSNPSSAFHVGDRTPEESYAELLLQLRGRGF